jgi:hypothetical protein
MIRNCIVEKNQHHPSQKPAKQNQTVFDQNEPKMMIIDIEVA